MNKKLVLALLLLVSATYLSKSQNVNGLLFDATNTATRDASAAFEINANTNTPGSPLYGGLLPPRVALTGTTDVTTISGTEANGLTVFNTVTAGDVTPGYYYWSTASSAWVRMLSGSFPTTVKWNAITAPDGDLTLAHTDKSTTFTFNGTTVGSAWNMSSNSVTTGRLADLSISGAATSGGVLNLSGNNTTPANFVGTVLYATTAGTAPSNGYAYFNFTGDHSGNGLLVRDVTTAGNASAIIANSLTSGSGLNASSTSTAFTGSLINATLSGSNAANTGTVLKATNSGVLNTGTALMVTNLGGATSTSFRVNDETGDADATPFIINSNGSVGIGIAAPFATLTNAGSTAFGVLAVANLATGGAIGTAAATVDIYTAFNVNQTTAAQTLSLPNPTTATAGRIVKVSNVGSAAFTMGTIVLGASQAADFFWNGTAWVAMVAVSGSPSLTTVPINNLLAATGTNTINNTNLAQTWNWNTMATGSALTLGSTSTVGTASSNSTILNLARSGANANATHTAYGIQSAVTNTGATSTNVAGYFSASGATNNYALVVPSTGGNVGVGLTTPTAKMSISSNGTELGGTSMSATFKTHAGTLGAVATNEIAAGSIGFTANTNRVALGVRGYRVSAGSDWTTSAIILGMDVDATVRAGGYISIGANGVIGIGVVPTSNTYKLNVQGGKLLTAGIDENSDARLKKDINPIYDALTKVNRMRGVTYNWRTEEFPDRNFEKDLQFGLIAQELEKVIPELVTTDSDGYKAIEYSHLVPVLIEAIKELDAKNNEQKVQLDKQTKTNEELKASIENLLIRMNAMENNVETKTNKAEK